MKRFVDGRHLYVRLCYQLMAWSFLVSNSVAEDSSRSAEKNELQRRQQTWQAQLNSSHATFNIRENQTIFNSLKHFKGDLPLHIVYDPKKSWELVFQFSTKDCQTISLRGHKRSSFCSKNQRLYFADFSPNEPGCSIVAFDLASGKELWRTKLHQEQPQGASAYHNFVMITMPLGPYTPDKKREESGAVVQVRGSETYCDYIEVLDSETGSSLAIRNYRVGFGSPQVIPHALKEKTRDSDPNSVERVEQQNDSPRSGF